MAGAFDERQRWRWCRSAAAMRVASAANFSSRAPAITSTGIVRSAELVPRRGLRAGAGLLEARSQARDGVLAGRSRRKARSGGSPREQRLSEPVVEERSRPSASSRCGGPAVLVLSGRSLGGVLDPRRAPQEHEPPDQLRVGEGDVQA